MSWQFCGSEKEHEIHEWFDENEMSWDCPGAELDRVQDEKPFYYKSVLIRFVTNEEIRPDPQTVSLMAGGIMISTDTQDQFHPFHWIQTVIWEKSESTN